jgi:hypothetical protein
MMTLRPATRLAICGLGVLAVSLVPPATSAGADRHDGALIRACVETRSPSSGPIRIVEANITCQATRRPLDSGVTDPPGPSAPACLEVVTVTWSRTTTAYPSGQLVAPSKARVQDRCANSRTRMSRTHPRREMGIPVRTRR